MEGNFERYKKFNKKWEKLGNFLLLSTFGESSWIRIRIKNLSPGVKNNTKKGQFTVFNWCPKIKSQGLTFEKLYFCYLQYVQMGLSKVSFERGYPEAFSKTLNVSKVTPLFEVTSSKVIMNILLWYWYFFLFVFLSAKKQSRSGQPFSMQIRVDPHPKPCKYRF